MLIESSISLTLSEKDLCEIAMSHIEPGDNVLITSTDGCQVTDIRTRLEEIPERPQDKEYSIEIDSGSQKRLPFDEDSFDTVIQWNSSRGVYQRHRPLYEATAVCKPGGTIIFRAPNYLPESDYIEHHSTYVVDWNSDDDALVSIMEPVGNPPRKEPDTITLDAFTPSDS
jgi:hypothetical protein